MNIIRGMMERIEAMRRKELPLEPSSALPKAIESADPFQAMHLTVAKASANTPLHAASNSAGVGCLPNINLVQVQGSELLSGPNSAVNSALSSLNAIKGMPSDLISF
jgi:hypothetical protein